MKEMISVGEARAIVLENTRIGPTESVDLRQAADRILREPIIARENIPPFDNSAMDGYAVRASDLADLPATLRVVADIPAGSIPDTRIESTTCARIMTGAMVPDGADAVAPVEWTDGFATPGHDVTFSSGPGVGQHIRRAGEDVAQGAKVISPGVRIRSTMIGSMASLGFGRVTVARKPTVSIVATGSELVEPSESPGPGRIRNSNGPALRAIAESAGANVIHESVAPDDYGQTRATLETASRADILIVSGGVSVGARDFVKDALDELGTRLLFWRVRQRPGKPLAFGCIGEKLVFGLPGNPVSSTVCFFQYVYPAIAKMLGLPADPKTRRARLTGPVAKAPGLYHFVPAISSVDDEGMISVRASGPQGSHVYSSMASADCLIHLAEEEAEPPPVGSMVTIEPLPC